MAKIRIHNMMFYGFHGVYEYEREQGQKFYFDVEMVINDKNISQTDDPADNVDAAAVYALVEDVVENKRFQLLETLAANISDHVLQAYPQLEEVTTWVRKPSVPISGPIDYVEVEVTRRAK
jgi:7,8-dihydroneopterin aldolase/epimerase/oxygenase